MYSRFLCHKADSLISKSIMSQQIRLLTVPFFLSSFKDEEICHSLLLLYFLSPLALSRYLSLSLHSKFHSESEAKCSWVKGVPEELMTTFYD